MNNNKLVDKEGDNKLTIPRRIVDAKTNQNK
jgi:hypothetical protein